METWLGRWGKAGEGVSVGKKGGFGRRDLRARRWREDPPAAPRILRGPGGRGSARARGGCGRVSTSSRVLRLRLRLARVFSPAVSVRVACVWRACGARVEARRGGSLRVGVGLGSMRRGVRWCARVVRVGRGNEPSKRRERGTARLCLSSPRLGYL